MSINVFGRVQIRVRKHRANTRGLCIVRGMPVKMKDIARDLGVLVVTISKALREHPDISKATRERILLKAKELGYRPNLTARSLVTGRSSLIGLIVPDLIHPFFADIAKALSRTMRQQGYFLVLSSSEEDADLEREEIEHMLAHRLDALIVATCQTGPESLSRIQQGDTPLILLDRSFKGDALSHFVGSDDYTAGKLATEHLLAVGCRRIAHIRGPGKQRRPRRLKGFLDTLKKRGVDLPAEYLIQAPRADVDGHENGVLALRRLRELHLPPDGIFCYNDVVAMGVIAEAPKPGHRGAKGTGGHRLRQSALCQRDSRASLQHRPEKRRDRPARGPAHSRHPRV